MTSSEAQVQQFEKFQVFDERFSIARGQEPETKEEAHTLLADLIDALPQREAIVDEDITRWVRFTYASSDDRLRDEGVRGSNVTVADVYRECLWHVRRASGFGGSESAAILAHYDGGKGEFESARNIVAGKLLKMAPMKGTVHMRRGVRAEDMIQSIFLKQSGCISLTDELEKLRSYRWGLYPMVIGTPDDIIQDPDLKRRVADYKAPSEAVFKEIQSHGAPHQYVCQLHHYFVIAASAQIKLDGLGLVPFNSQEWDATEMPVDLDKDLIRKLVASCDNMWTDFVMEGCLPEDPQPVVLNDEDEDPEIKEALRITAVKSTVFSQIEKAIGKLSIENRSTVASIVGDTFNLSTGDVDLGYAKLSRSRKWDEEALCEIAVSAGLELTDFDVVDEKKVDQAKVVEIMTAVASAIEAEEDPMPLIRDSLEGGLPKVMKKDLDAMAKAIEDAGMSPLPAAEVSERLNVSRKKKGPEFLMVSNLQELASGVASMIDDNVSSSVQDIHEDILRLPEPPEPRPEEEEYGMDTF